MKVARLIVVITAVFVAVLSVGNVSARQIDDSCVINVLNRTVQVDSNGNWELLNVPAGLGKIRARATCVANGETLIGETPYSTK
jgi:hypothetical protein